MYSGRWQALCVPLPLPIQSSHLALEEVGDGGSSPKFEGITLLGPSDLGYPGLFVLLAMCMKLVTEVVFMVSALEQEIWHDIWQVCKCPVTIILNPTPEVLRGVPENPLNSRHNPSCSQCPAVTQFPLVNKDESPGQYRRPPFAYWFSSMEKSEWLSGSANFQFAGTIVVFPVGSIPFWGQRILNQHSLKL